MIPNITRGAKMTGLVVYLAGPGKSNEHENQHVVAGHESVLLAAPTGELTHSDAIELAHELDTARVVFGTEVSVTNKRAMSSAIDDGVSRSVALADATSDQNVWHCSLSLNPDEGELSDEKWAAIAADFMKEMDFDDPDSPRAPARWVAIRHGKTKAGGDHIHIAASAVREDGTKVNTFNDFKRAHRACNTLEHRYGLEVLTSREADKGTRGLKPAELEKAKRDGLAEPVRVSLERTVRAAATASKTEAEFVRRLRSSGLLVRPRYDKGSVDAGVVGYSVAAAPTKAERAAGLKPVWFGGGRLAKDLTLPRLRDEWDQSTDARTAAESEWSSSRRGAAVTVTNGRERARIDPELVARAAQDIEKWNKYLSSIPVDDHAQWARAAGRTSGVFAAWSSRVESTPGPLAAASRALAHAAQMPSHQRAPRVDKRLSGGGAALILMQAQIQSSGASQVLLLRQLMRTMDAIADARRAAGDLARANELVASRSSDLEMLHADLSSRFRDVPERTAGGTSTALMVDQKQGVATSHPQSTEQTVTAGLPDDQLGTRTPTAADAAEGALDPDVLEALRVSRLSSGSVDQARAARRTGDVTAAPERELTEEELQVQRTVAVTTQGVEEKWGQKPTAREVEASSGSRNEPGREGQER
ncbi:relaxase/mobilization nuclease domain-containing protein [Rhodococcoides fascians]|uniref:relaxase/mobilization nuclease domain-containing protein n=1 Tax=Rhodococcoides fascians TaxID=1828 RepID=UPI000AA64335|nr:relaxase/mobilization nuclease domain-containing protein [Rhodococcus fascians]